MSPIGKSVLSGACWESVLPLLAGAFTWLHAEMYGSPEKSPGSLKLRPAASLSCAHKELGAVLGLCSYMNAAKWGLRRQNLLQL